LLSVARRPSDLVARYGGEEFALVLPDTDAAAMPLVVGSLLDSIRALGIESCGRIVTISAGAVTTIPARESTPSSVIEAADRLLYEAKRGGRNYAMHADLSTGARLRVDSAASRRVPDEMLA
jgi:two-component system chemotaxis family response regulator WspR